MIYPVTLCLLFLALITKILRNQRLIESSFIEDLVLHHLPSRIFYNFTLEQQVLLSLSECFSNPIMLNERLSTNPCTLAHLDQALQT